ncbi:amidohydrolase [uncultured Imperialibacter sp.]|uniref:amidohydrolase n=1 Tax=uncultured Imperialibacter sp. TaxID=1672639 RepID=UPI0030D7F619|tara:strand:+ start:16886 stop:18571 length:1686 start_codon:yes stop_codon:yes gene_type:complete
MKPTILLIVLGLAFAACQETPKADMVIWGGNIYTAVGGQKAEAVAVTGDSIIYVGGKDGAEDMVGPETQVIDLEGKTMTPGFIESHAHIMGVGYNLMNVDLMATTSYEELVAQVKKAAEETPEGEWILGRGWHQDKWIKPAERMVDGFQTHHLLSEAVPNHPVFLSHASGHAGFANAKAMELAGITKETKTPDGGDIFRDINGEPTGLFNETAQGLIRAAIPENTMEKQQRALELAVQACLELGITSFQNAGAGKDDIELFKQFAEEGKLKIRLYTMLSGHDQNLLEEYYDKGPEIGLGDNHLTVRSIKLYSDGALGSRGAWLLEEYSDMPGVFGHNVTPMEEIEKVTNEGLAAGFQICTHAIGDRGNQEVLDIYEAALKNNPEKAKDSRFRIEHAQHLDLADIPRFAELGVIAAMQAIHMSSDRPWAINRLGEKRIVDGAYVWQKLLQSGAKVINGTDAPVEPLAPLPSFYASVTRKTLKGTPEGGYEADQKMTREQALVSYTLDAAYGAFEEDIKGSIEVGKLADFTVFDKDIMTIDEKNILDTQVMMTIVGGEVLFEK